MQFFDLNHQFPRDAHCPPIFTLEELNKHHWFLAKVRVEYNCLSKQELVSGQAVLQSNHNLQIELDWVIHDTGHELQVLFKGIETNEYGASRLLVTGAQLVDQQQHLVSVQALSLWIDSSLLSMLPKLRRDIKSYLGLWDYVEYDV